MFHRDAIASVGFPPEGVLVDVDQVLCNLFVIHYNLSSNLKKFIHKQKSLSIAKNYHSNTYGVAKTHQLLRCCDYFTASTYVSTLHCSIIARLVFGGFCLAISIDTFCESINTSNLKIKKGECNESCSLIAQSKTVFDASSG